jgi:hypothetical protein
MIADTTTMPNSNTVRLTGRQWLAAGGILLALMLSAPRLWRHAERFHPGPDYRIPYEFSSDYWLYRRYSDWAGDREKIAVIGDSVVWGHYVSPDATLSHYLNAATGSDRFVNLGLDGTHPAALQGLLAHYTGRLAGRAVVLQFNPLWLTSEKHDLQTPKEFHFNHAKLVPQFAPKIPCYRASLSTRLWAVTERYVPFFSWTSHLKIAYFNDMDLPGWTLQHPYDNPLARRSSLITRDRHVEDGDVPGATDVKTIDVAWVTLDSSLQWRFFRHAVEQLCRRGCRVFVLVGPLNEHMLNDEDAATYERIKGGIRTWLEAHNMPHAVPSPLPVALYADLSHPRADGYAQLAAEILRGPALESIVSANPYTWR